MSDDELLRLEREAAERPEARVRWARALERAGREGAAWAALVAGAAEELPRQELARRPAWTHARGSAGRTSWLDVPPLAATPRLRWHLADPQASPFAARDGLLGGGLGLVTCRGALAITVLEPDTGLVRATTPVNGAAAPPCTLAGEVMLIHCDLELRAVHLRTDRDLWQLALDLPRGEVRRWALDDAQSPLRPGAGEPVPLPSRFQHHHAFGRSEQGGGQVVATGPIRAADVPRSSFFIGDTLRVHPAGDLLLASMSTNDLNAARHAGLERPSGRPRWEAEGTVEAYDGEAVITAHLRALTLRERDGTGRWRVEGPDPIRVEALTPEAVVVSRGERLEVLERATGVARADLGPRQAASALAIARDGIYLARRGALECRGLDGALRWELPLAALARTLDVADPARAAQVHALVPAPGRLFAKARDGTVYAFEEP